VKIVALRLHSPPAATLVMVATKTTEPRILRNGLTPPTTSSTAQMRRATSEAARTTISVRPEGRMDTSAMDKRMKADNGMLGHWATVIRPVRRLRNIQRTARRTMPAPFLGTAPFDGVILR